jgi:hypothetical protein
MSELAGSERLVSYKIYITLFVAILAAITAQASVRTVLLELPLHVIGWGLLLAIGLTAGWVAARSDSDGDQGLQNIVALLGIGIFVYQIMYSTMEIALSQLLVWLLIAMCICLTNRRTLYFILLSSFCLMMYSASLSKDSLFLIIMLIYVMAMVVTLVLDYYSARIHQSLVADEQQQRTIPVVRIGLIIGLPIIIITTGLYLLVPRPPAAHYGFFQAGGSHFYHDGEWQANAVDSDVDSNPDNHDNQNHSDREPAGNNQDTSASSGSSESFSLNDPRRTMLDGDRESDDIANEIVLYMQGARGNTYVAQYLIISTENHGIPVNNTPSNEN